MNYLPYSQKVLRVFGKDTITDDLRGHLSSTISGEICNAVCLLQIRHKTTYLKMHCLRLSMPNRSVFYIEKTKSINNFVLLLRENFFKILHTKVISICKQDGRRGRLTV